MAQVLMIYGTAYGQTERIARRYIRNFVRRHAGHGGADAVARVLMQHHILAVKAVRAKLFRKP